jgi:hypothetical protein
MPKLKTEIDTPEMRARVLAAFEVHLDGEMLHNHTASYEHGQWWVEGDGNDGEHYTFSVVDATGGQSVDGFDFEEV